MPLLDWRQRVNGLVVPLGPAGDTSIDVTPGPLRCPFTTPKCDGVLQGEIHVLQKLHGKVLLARIANQWDVEVQPFPETHALFGDAKTIPRPCFRAKELTVYVITFDILAPCTFEAAVAFTQMRAPNIVLASPRRLSGPIRPMGNKRKLS